MKPYQCWAWNKSTNVKIPFYTPETYSESTGSKWNVQTPVGSTTHIVSYAGMDPTNIELTLTYHVDMLSELNFVNDSSIRIRTLREMANAWDSMLFPEVVGQYNVQPEIWISLGTQIMKGYISKINNSWEGPMTTDGERAVLKVTLSFTATRVVSTSSSEVALKGKYI